MLVPFSRLPAAPVAGVGEGVGLVVLAIGITMGLLLTAGKNKLTIKVYIGTTGIVGLSFAAETKYLRAGDAVPGGGGGGIVNL